MSAPTDPTRLDQLIHDAGVALEGVLIPDYPLARRTARHLAYFPGRSDPHVTPSLLDALTAFLRAGISKVHLTPYDLPRSGQGAYTVDLRPLRPPT